MGFNGTPELYKLSLGQEMRPGVHPLILKLIIASAEQQPSQFFSQPQPVAYAPQTQQQQPFRYSQQAVPPQTQQQQQLMYVPQAGIPYSQQPYSQPYSQPQSGGLYQVTPATLSQSASQPQPDAVYGTPQPVTSQKVVD